MPARVETAARSHKRKAMASKPAEAGVRKVKRAVDACNYFVQDACRRLSATLPPGQQVNVMTLASAEWKVASDLQKAPFLRLAAADKERCRMEK